MNPVPPRTRTYTPDDQGPPGSEEFYPAAFYPVYMGNFFCNRPAELAACVQAFFTARGLMVRMVFSRDAASDPFRTLQTRNCLYDCLVYFCRPEDAEDAENYLHRYLYYGHRVLENDLNSKVGAQVVCIVKHAVCNIYVEFDSSSNMQQVLTGYRFCEPSQVSPNQPKQRFLEHEVIGEVTANLDKLKAQMPSSEIQDALFGRHNPPTLLPDYAESKVRKVDMRIGGRKTNKKKMHRQVARAIAQNFGSRAAFADQLRPDPQTVAQRAIRKVEAKAQKRGLDMDQWWARFPNATQTYFTTAAGNPRDVIPYVRFRPLPESADMPYTYDDLFNLGLKYIAYVRPKHRY
ncbi:hypothetical protein pipiens_002698 [Culex pipiens pipiens]|uniref:Uncharacterized protein n=1 Tax=Culex pipiens pipiens TaxID=38569 RepID=A0ABD1D9T0_CULPP